MKLIITNNPYVYEIEKNINVLFLEEQDYLDVLITARDFIHQNFRLITHPLSGNFLPDKTVYKTVVLEEQDTLHEESVLIIEEAISFAEQAQRNRDLHLFSKNILTDLKLIDYEIIRPAL